MSKNKKKLKQQVNIPQSVTAIAENGLIAFRQNNLKKAIEAWEKIPAQLRPAAWLAEAHFRIGLALFYRSDNRLGLSNLQTARKYQPDDPRYSYHVGLALHHLGDVTGALSAYQAAKPFAARCAYPPALALLQTGQDPSSAATWEDLSLTEQSMLRSASIWQSRRPYKLPPEAPLLWHALAALDANEHTQARTGLEQVLARNASLAEKAVANYYLGVLAARAEEWDTARRAWGAAAAGGLKSTRLRSNLAEIYQRHAEDLLAQNDAQAALAAVEEAKRNNPGDNTLKELSAQIHQQLGFEAATANRWDKAQAHWQTAVDLDSASFRLAYNLALAYEKSENYLLAGQTWREALRRRPRRADHPDALSEEQVARIWQRAAECYNKAGEFGEVAHTYQQAIKWAPENVNLRLALAENLMRDGRLQAARNELERVLELDPKNMSALLRLGEAHFRDEASPWSVKQRAKNLWEKALQIDPKNSQAKQLMGEWYEEQGKIAYTWDEYKRAIENYTKSLEYNPKNIEVLCFLAKCHINLGDKNRGGEYASQALSLATNFEDYASIIIFSLDIKDDEHAWDVTNQAETRFGKVPVNFYVAMAEKMLKAKNKSAALAWIQRAIEKAVPQDNVLVMIGEMTLILDDDLTREYLQKALQAGQMPGHVHLLLARLDDRDGNQRASKNHLSEAERIARQTKDDDLAKRIEVIRMLSGGPETILNRLREIGGPGIVEAFLKDVMNFEDFDDD